MLSYSNRCLNDLYSLSKFTLAMLKNTEILIQQRPANNVGQSGVPAAAV